MHRPRVTRPTLQGKVLIVLLTAVLGGCGERIHHFAGFAQGTMYHVAYVAPVGHDSAEMQRRVEEELQRIDRLYSNYRDDSVVERFNAFRSMTPVEVGSEMVGLVERGRQVNAASHGCFDPTIVPLAALWRDAAESGKPPGEIELERVRGWVGIDRLEAVDATRLRKRHPDLALDLSAIAQGASLGRLGGILEADGITAYMIEIGGEIIVRGSRPGNKPWRIAVLDPGLRDRMLPEIITHAEDAALTIATSGTYFRRIEIDGQSYSHVIDARTGRPVTHDSVSVTVVHVDPALADAWSTALLCLGSEDGRAVAAERDLAALFILRDGRIETTPAWPGGK